LRGKYRDQARHADDVLILDDGSTATEPFDSICDAVGGATANRLLASLLWMVCTIFS